MKRVPAKGFPRGHKALTLEGFVYLNAGECADCGAAVQWYTTPRGKRMPVDAAKHVPHFWCCPALVKGARPRPAQLELFA